MKKRIYLDYAAATPVDAEVTKAMAPYFSRVFGNPNSTHWEGQQASAAVFRARQAIAEALGAHYEEIVFTGSASEANHLAFDKIYRTDKTNGANKIRVIVSAVEHESVITACRALEGEGVEVVKIPVNHEGIIDLEKLKVALNERTALVSVQYANSEIGVIQPIAEIAKIIRNFRNSSLQYPASHYPVFHIDVTQAFQFLPCRVDELSADLMTISSHKIYGPKGVAGLYITKNVKCKMQSLGRGTENVPGIVGFGRAVELAERARKKEGVRLETLRDYLWRGIQKLVPDAELNGSREHRLPHILNVYFPGRSAQDMVIELDLIGLAVSAGTACASRAAEPSRVIEALGFSGDRPSSSLRFSLGRPTTRKDIDAALTILRRRFKKILRRRV